MQAYQKGKFAGFCHVHIGQEALAAGVQRTLSPRDHMISGYRSHTQAIGKGIAPEQVFAELFGKVDGCAMGKGGSMHMFSKEHRFYGGHGIVGGQTPIAAGIGFEIRYSKKDEVVVCYLGDGACNQGQFFEALNLVATWKLPVLYIIENNQYGMGTDYRRVTSVEKLGKRADAFDIEHSEVDGMNVLKVMDHVAPIVEGMRRTQRPHLLEAMTYRYRGHSVSDPGHYRTKEEVAHYQGLDPIIQLGELMKESYGYTDETLKAIDRTVRTKIDQAEAFADNSPKPDVALAFQHVYAD
jgi:pyruvate dehydrogenase E1 component alpha subunit